MKKTKIELLEEELDECYNIMMSLIIEKDVAMYTHESKSIKEIHEQIKAIQKRQNALKSILNNEKNPYNDFLCVLEINKGT